MADAGNLFPPRPSLENSSSSRRNRQGYGEKTWLTRVRLSKVPPAAMVGNIGPTAPVRQPFRMIAGRREKPD